MQGTKLFSDIKELSPQTLDVLSELGFKTATPVQEACIPLFTGNKDVAVDACTGSGKTLAFVVPLIERLRRLEDPLQKCQVGGLIISPTRELAKQIFDVAAPFVATISWAKALLLVGGGDASVDVKQFEAHGGNLIVSTPGRLIDVIKRSQLISFKNLEMLILDEADRLLDMGFRKQLDQILKILPKQRRTGLFSATQTEAVEELARAGLRNPVRVKVAVRPAEMDQNATGASSSQKTPLGLTISCLTCESTEKLSHLLNFLKEHASQKVIVFALTCALVEYYGSIFKNLSQAKESKVWTLHGRMKQNQRQSVLEAFTSHPSGALICTDVAARGLDIPDVHWILQLDPPQDPDAVVHRVGRTARMGKIGNALIYLLPHEEAYIEFLRVRKMFFKCTPHILSSKVPFTILAHLLLHSNKSIKIPIQELQPSSEPDDLMPSLRKLSESDRDILEKGIRAFVSYIRGYKEHQCKYIFQMKDLDLGKLANACGLLQLPRMPEIRKLAGKVAGFTPSDVNPNLVEFKDKARQKARTKRLAENLAKISDAKERTKGTKQKRAEKPKQEETVDKRIPAAKRRMLEDRQDVSEFADEYTLLKRLKKGKITEEEFDQATGVLIDVDDELEDQTKVKANGDHHQSNARGHKKAEKKFRKAKAKKASFGQKKGSKARQKPNR